MKTEAVLATFQPPIMDSYHSTSDTVNVPDHVYYIFGSCIIVIGTIGVLGNLLIFYAVYRNKKLRTAPNVFIINLAVSDFLMCAIQSPVFFVSSLNKRWIFGDVGCKLYGFCGALFGITSMITLMAISIDRYWVITKPLQSIDLTTKKNTLKVIVLVWLYSLAWTLPPLFGWSSYIPEGLMTSCTWDYVTNSPSNRSYTLMLCCFVFFVPLIVISYCYICMFRAVKHAGRDIEKMGGLRRKTYETQQQTIKAEWKLAKIAFVAIVLFVLSWSPYTCVTLVGWTGHGDILTPYSKTVPAVLAKASAIYNPIIYAIFHPNYRRALAKSIPCLCYLSCVRRKNLMLGSISDSSESALVITRQSLALKPKVTSCGKNETLTTNPQVEKERCLTEYRGELASRSLNLSNYSVWNGTCRRSQDCELALSEIEWSAIEQDLDVLSGIAIPQIVVIPTSQNNLYEDSLPVGEDSFLEMSAETTVQIHNDPNWINLDLFGGIQICPSTDHLAFKRRTYEIAF